MGKNSLIMAIFWIFEKYAFLTILRPTLVTQTLTLTLAKMKSHWHRKLIVSRADGKKFTDHGHFLNFRKICIFDRFTAQTWPWEKRSKPWLNFQLRRRKLVVSRSGGKKFTDYGHFLNFWKICIFDRSTANLSYANPNPNPNLIEFSTST